MELAHLGNVYFDAKHPWKDAKSQETIARMQTTIASCLHCLKALALVSYPVMPQTAEKLWRMLGCDFSAKMLWQDILQSTIPTGTKLPEPQLLFQRIEPEQIAAEKENLHKMHAAMQANLPKHYQPAKAPIDINAFKQLHLRVGLILGAESVKNSKKLLCLQVDLGSEKRQIVSGISAYYKPDELIGKKVVVVANLPVATLMGVESQGNAASARVLMAI